MAGLTDSTPGYRPSVPPIADHPCTAPHCCAFQSQAAAVALAVALETAEALVLALAPPLTRAAAQSLALVVRALALALALVQNLLRSWKDRCKHSIYHSGP